MKIRTFASRLPKHKDLTCIQTDAADMPELKARIESNAVTGYFRQDREGGPILVPAHKADELLKEIVRASDEVTRA